MGHSDIPHGVQAANTGKVGQAKENETAYEQRLSEDLCATCKGN